MKSFYEDFCHLVSILVIFEATEGVSLLFTGLVGISLGSFSDSTAATSSYPMSNLCYGDFCLSVLR